MIFTPLACKGAYQIDPDILADERGSFFRFYSAEEFRQIGHHKPWVQLNHSYSKEKGTVRGLHFQYPPYTEIKMVKCIRGKVWDLMVDLRHGSESFLQWTAIELSADNKRMAYIPEGFAHGFQTLTDECELIYHHSANYVKESEGGVRWNDPLLNIEWPLAALNLSSRDQQHALLTKTFEGIKL